MRENELKSIDCFRTIQLPLFIVLNGLYEKGQPHIPNNHMLDHRSQKSNKSHPICLHLRQRKQLAQKQQQQQN